MPVRSIFLDASNEALMRRFSETRRPHPLRQGSAGDAGGTQDDGHRLLKDAIQLERELLGGLKAESTVIDTSQLRPAQLRLWMRDMVQATTHRWRRIWRPSPRLA